MPVVDPPDDRPREAHQQPARQGDQPGDQGAAAQHVLDVERHHDDRAEQAHEADDHQAHRHREPPVGERSQIQQGAIGPLQPHLAGPEDDHRDRAHGQRNPRGHAPTAVPAEFGEPEHQARERDRRQRHRGGVDRGGLFALVGHPQPHQARGQREQGDGQHDPEHPPPVQRAEDEAGQGRSHRRRDGDDDRDRAHRLPATLGRDQRHDRRHQQRHHDGGTARLQDAPRQQHREAGRQGADQRARTEQRHRPHEDAPHRESLQQRTGHRDHHRHGQQEAAGQPLRRAGRDVQVGDQRGQRDAHDRFVEDHHERGEHQHRDDHGGARRGGW